MATLHRRLLERENGVRRNYTPGWMSRVFTAAREQTDGVSSDSDDGGEWHGPGFYPERSRQINA